MRAIWHRDYESVEIVQCELFCCSIATKLEAHACCAKVQARSTISTYSAWCSWRETTLRQRYSASH